MSERVEIMRALPLDAMPKRVMCFKLVLNDVEARLGSGQI